MTTKTAQLDAELAELANKRLDLDERYQAALADLAMSPGDEKLHAVVDTAEKEVQQVAAKIARLTHARRAAWNADRDAAELEAQQRAQEHFVSAGKAHATRQKIARRMDELLAELHSTGAEFSKSTATLRMHLAGAARGVYGSDQHPAALETVVRRLSGMHETPGPSFAALLERVLQAAQIPDENVKTAYFRHVENRGAESIADDVGLMVERVFSTLQDAARTRNFPLE